LLLSVLADGVMVLIPAGQNRGNSKKFGKGDQEPVGYQAPYPLIYFENPADAWCHSNYMRADKKYAEACKALRIHTNSQITKTLQADLGWFHDLLNVDFSKNYLGERGFLAMLPLLQANHKWRFLGLARCGIRNEGVFALVDMLLRNEHKATGRPPFQIDLSWNTPSKAAVDALLQLAQENPNFCGIMITGTNETKSRVSIVKLRDAVAKNRTAAEQDNRDLTIPPALPPPSRPPSQAGRSRPPSRPTRANDKGDEATALSPNAGSNQGDAVLEGSAAGDGDNASGGEAQLDNEGPRSPSSNPAVEEPPTEDPGTEPAADAAPDNNDEAGPGDTEGAAEAGEAPGDAGPPSTD